MVGAWQGREASLSKRIPPPATATCDRTGRGTLSFLLRNAYGTPDTSSRSAAHTMCSDAARSARECVLFRFQAHLRTRGPVYGFTRLRLEGGALVVCGEGVEGND